MNTRCVTTGRLLNGDPCWAVFGRFDDTGLYVMVSSQETFHWDALLVDACAATNDLSFRKLRETSRKYGFQTVFERWNAHPRLYVVGGVRDNVVPSADGNELFVSWGWHPACGYFFLATSTPEYSRETTVVDCDEIFGRLTRAGMLDLCAAYGVGGHDNQLTEDEM